MKTRPVIQAAVAALLLLLPTVALAQQGTTQVFEITLIRASEGAPEMPALKDGDATQALVDLMEVLPYTAFEVIDSSRVMTHAGARVRLGEAGAFEVFLSIDTQASGGQIIVEHFELDQRAMQHDGEWIYNDPENLLATSFGIRSGETVVVGTSRVMYADQAIIVLVKALN